MLTGEKGVDLGNDNSALENQILSDEEINELQQLRLQRFRSRKYQEVKGIG